MGARGVRPLGIQPPLTGALDSKVTVPAWKVRPSWYVVATDERKIPSAAQRQMASRAKSPPWRRRVATMSTCTGAVAKLIQQAAADVLKQLSQHWPVSNCLGANSVGAQESLRARSIVQYALRKRCGYLTTHDQ